MTRARRIALVLAVLAALGVAAGAAAAAGGPSEHASPRAFEAVQSRPVCPDAAAETARCGAEVVVEADGATPAASTTPVGYTPAQLRAAYGLPAAAPTVQTIAIVDAYDDPTAEKDLATYSAQFGLPACTTANGCFRKVNQSGGTSYPAVNVSWALEISLDLQDAHAVCPNCKLLLVEAKSAGIADLMAAVDRAVALGARIVSNSYGATEFSTETKNDLHFNKSGVAFVAASGDAGYGVQWPAASPYVTAVGGTTLTLNADGTRAAETAWAKAGSGCSAYEPKPAWQKDTGCARRSVADVSAVADPATGVAVVDTTGYNGWYRVGGTSLATPLLAGIYALAGNVASTSAGSYPYAHAAGLLDVVSGSTGTCGSYLCVAGPGYDGPSGLGAPVGVSAF